MKDLVEVFVIIFIVALVPTAFTAFVWLAIQALFVVGAL